MATRPSIQKDMRVIASDGAGVGTVDDVTADHIKLTRSGSPDAHHHLVPMGWVARVEEAVYLNRATADVLALGAASGAAGGILPPIANPAVQGATKRSNYYLPWILLALALLVILLLLTRSCAHQDERAGPVTPTQQTAPLAVEAVTLPGGVKINVAPDTLNYALQRYLASDEPTPRAFTFDKLNFNTAKANIRPEDEATVDTLAQILNAYPNARAQVVGYADARGTAPDNASLGQARADSVLAALTAKGVAKDRLNATSGGAGNPVASNATARGQFENRRTELVVTAK